MGLGVAAAAALMWSCTEDPLALDAGTAPGVTSVTRDIKLRASELPLWRDTTVTGFARPETAAFSLVVNGSDLAARTLARLNVPDTVRTFADTLPATEFSELSVRIQIDTLRSEFAGFPVTMRMISLTQGFESDRVTWDEAGPGRPWMVPGGDLGPQLGSVQMEALTDSLVMTLDVDPDSLLKAWRATDGEPGFVLTAEGPDARIQVLQVLFRYDALLEGRTVPVERNQPADPRTFITDPTIPDPGLPLRIAGLPTARFYMEFEPPDSVGGIPLRGATINHAELEFHPLPPPPGPFALERGIATRQIPLLGDPFILGEKTPIGAPPLNFTLVSPDSLAAGVSLRIDVTGLIQRAANASGRIRIGMRADPDAQALGYWEFGSVESPLALQPELRIILTPPPDFEVP